MDGGYENIHITNSLNAQTSVKSDPPTVPQFPKKVKYSKRIPPPELPKLQGDYAFLGNYRKLKAIHYSIYNNTNKSIIIGCLACNNQRVDYKVTQNLVSELDYSPTRHSLHYGLHRV